MELHQFVKLEAIFQGSIGKFSLRSRRRKG